MFTEKDAYNIGTIYGRELRGFHSHLLKNTFKLLLHQQSPIDSHYSSISSHFVLLQADAST